MDRRQSGEQLNVDDQLVFSNGRVDLIMQTEGNFVLYRTDDSRPLWASNTWQKPVKRTVMQGDGNLVATRRTALRIGRPGQADTPGRG